MIVAFRKGPKNKATRVESAEILRMENYGEPGGGDDIALVRLKSAVSGVTPIPLLDGPAFRSVALVERFGFGPTTHGGLQSDTAEVRKSVEGVWSWRQAEGGNPTCTNRPYGPGCWYAESKLFTRSTGRGEATKGDSGGPALVRLAQGQYAVAGVSAVINIDNGGYTCLSNRVDTGSRAWNFIRSRIAGGVAVTGPQYLDGSLIKSGISDWVYVVYGGAKFRIPDVGSFNALGYSWSAIKTIPVSTLDSIPTVPQNGTVLREYTNPTVYMIDGGRRRAITPAEYDNNDYGAFLHYLPNGGLTHIPLA